MAVCLGNYFVKRINFIGMFFLRTKYYCPLLFCLLCILEGCRQPDEIRPSRKDIIDAVFGSGLIQQREQYAVAANADGYLKTVYITAGDSIKAGQHLFRLSDEVPRAQVANAFANYRYARENTASNAPQIDQLKVQIVQAQEKYRTDSMNYLRYQRLVQTQAVATSDYENVKLGFQSSAANVKVLQHSLADLERTVTLNLENSRSQYKIQQENNNYYTLASRADGAVLEVDKLAGDYVKKGDIIARIGAGAPYLKLYIAEDDIQRISPGQLALISLNNRKEQVFRAAITKIIPFFDNTQQAYTVEATFIDPPGKLLNGTQLQANVLVAEKKQAMVIPSWYLINGDYVMIKDGKGKQPVKVGIRTLEWSEILQGLHEQDVLIQPK
jgi:macrolide-specific efflux system membrane fusion protein